MNIEYARLWENEKYWDRELRKFLPTHGAQECKDYLKKVMICKNCGKDPEYKYSHEEWIAYLRKVKVDFRIPN